MCGINGVLSSVDFVLERRLGLMNDKIIHRGPDDDGFFFESKQSYSLGMSMRRLAIIDLDSGKQPISTEDGNYTIVFNGEIYNYRELKIDLEKTGVKFKTKSDTEVALQLFVKFGVDSFSMLDGMFALSIYDSASSKLYLARDFFGEKPLYYLHDHTEFIWASELKSIIIQLNKKPAIDKTALNLFFQLTYIPAPYTIYQGVRKLKPNNYIIVDCKTNNVEIGELSKIANSNWTIGSKDSAIRITRDLVNESVESRTIADVEVGTFLSGGVDSSIISLCMSQQSNSKVNTFSIGFENPEFDESIKARQVSKLIGSNHTEIIVGNKEMAKSMGIVLENFDEPYANSSAVVSYIVSKNASLRIGVALTGDGGDELFCGYNKYYIGKLNSFITTYIPENVFKSLKGIADRNLKNFRDKRGGKYRFLKLLNSISYTDEFYQKIISLGFTLDQLEQLLIQEATLINNEHWLRDLYYFLPKSFLEFREVDRMLSLDGDLLSKTDRTSMLVSLECRAPFLNKKIWDFTQQLPERILMNGWDKKHLLKESFKEFFPQYFLDGPKKGFSVPIGEVLRTELRLELESFVEIPFLKEQSVFNIDFVRKMVNEHLQRKKDSTFPVWTFYCFQKWYTGIYSV